MWVHVCSMREAGPWAYPHLTSRCSNELRPCLRAIFCLSVSWECSGSSALLYCIECSLLGWDVRSVSVVSGAEWPARHLQSIASFCRELTACLSFTKLPAPAPLFYFTSEQETRHTNAMWDDPPPCDRAQTCRFLYFVIFNRHPCCSSSSFLLCFLILLENISWCPEENRLWMCIRAHGSLQPGVNDWRWLSVSGCCAWLPLAPVFANNLFCCDTGHWPGASLLHYQLITRVPSGVRKNTLSQVTKIHLIHNFKSRGHL